MTTTAARRFKGKLGRRGTALVILGSAKVCLGLGYLLLSGPTISGLEPLTHWADIRFWALVWIACGGITFGCAWLRIGRDLIGFLVALVPPFVWGGDVPVERGDRRPSGRAALCGVLRHRARGADSVGGDGTRALRPPGAPRGGAEMNGSWGVVAPVIGSMLGALALVGSGLFAARATRAAARTTAEAQRAAALAAAEPNQRQADLATFREIREGMERKLDQHEQRIDSLTSLVRAFSWYVAELTGHMRSRGIDPPAPPPRIDEYNRTGV